MQQSIIIRYQDMHLRWVSGTSMDGLNGVIVTQVVTAEKSMQ